MAQGWAAVGPAAEEHLAQPLRDTADVTWCHLSLSASSKPQNGFLPIPTPPFSSSAAHGNKSHLIYSVVGGSWCWWEQSPWITIGIKALSGPSLLSCPYQPHRDIRFPSTWAAGRHFSHGLCALAPWVSAKRSTSSTFLYFFFYRPSCPLPPSLLFPPSEGSKGKRRQLPAHRRPHVTEHAVG